jgi:hypothetical protein
MDQGRPDAAGGYHPFRYMDGSVFPPTKRAAYLAEENPELDVQGNYSRLPNATSTPAASTTPSPPPQFDMTNSAVPPPPPSAADAWRENKHYVYTGEAFVYAPRNPRREYIWDIPPPPEELEFPETLKFEDLEDTVYPDDIPFRYPGCPYPKATPPMLAPRASPARRAPAPPLASLPATPAQRKPNPTPKQTPNPTLNTKSALKAASTTMSTAKRSHTQSRADSHSPSATAVTRRRRRRQTAASAQPITEWNDAALLSLWEWKTIKKKGFGPMLKFFPGQTEESLRATWEENREYCRELGRRWERSRDA